ncbi:MAG TPA: cytochrome c oxidase subunit II [Thermoanaerobaculia bacterium]|jgi:cytochrome c oxidase subunit 2|nr:cytochrome c oxidase subunit II [Thermoanaerobaculia bacterium]
MKEFLAQWMPPDYSAHGAELDTLSAYVHWLMLILFIGWGLLFVFMLLRFRASKHPKAVYHGTRSHASKWAEIAVFAIECVLLFGISIPAWSRWTSRPTEEAKVMEIRVVAEQFAWNIHYPGADGKFGRTDVNHVSSSNPLGIDPADPAAKDDVATLNQLHLVVNQPVVIRISSKDVIHSFFLPYMRVKQDATPGMEVPVHFTPVKTSGSETWEIACAQLCGLGHYRMKGQFHVHTAQDFAKWMTEQQPVVASISG